MEPSDSLKGTLDSLPDRPGVYLMKGAAGEILYVGKAKRLRDRVRSYFRDSVDHPRTRRLVSRTESVETIVVETEEQALEVEYDLIKEHRPRFNIAFRDNKRFPYIKVTVGEPYPRVLTTRQKKPDDARYFGPYTNVGSMRQTLETVREIFPYRSCNDDFPPGGDAQAYSVCMDYHLKQCEGPCEGLQTQEDYRSMIQDLCQFLSGDYEPVRRRLRGRMEEHADRHEYEAAAIYRDRLNALEKTVDYQPFVESTREADVLGLGEAEGVTTVVLLSIREHRVINRREFPIRARGPSRSEAARDFIMTYYPSRSRLPRRILVEEAPTDREGLERHLSRQAEGTVDVEVPERGEKRRLVDSARRTAELSATDESIALRKREGDVLSTARDLLDLPALPRVIEGFDVSTTQGHETVAGMVRFVDGEPEKQDYRRFRVRDVDGADDYASLQEAVRRRYRRLLAEDRQLPDVVFVDGGRGQLTAAREVLDEVGCDRPVVSLAKREELLYVNQRQAPFDLPESSKVLQLFQRVRDEAHRFAIRYHRDRRQGAVGSRLKEIRGIGDQRLKMLMERFGSPVKARQSSVEELTDLPGITPKIAREIKRLEPRETG